MAVRYSISDLAKAFDVTPRTLRFYEEKGLLKPARTGQQRIYSNADRTRLKLILRGKRLGLSLEESAEIIGMYDPKSSNKKQLEKLVEAIRDKRRMLEQQQMDLANMLDDLNEYEQRALAAIKGSE